MRDATAPWPMPRPGGVANSEHDLDVRVMFSNRVGSPGVARLVVTLVELEMVPCGGDRSCCAGRGGGGGGAVEWWGEQLK